MLQWVRGGLLRRLRPLTGKTIGRRLGWSAGPGRSADAASKQAGPVVVAVGQRGRDGRSLR
jgi:hypothetical protein